MSAENVERLLAAYARFNAGEKEPSLDDWHEDAEYVASSEDPDSDTHRGIEAIRQQFARWVEAYPDLRVEPLETRSNGDKIFVWVRFIGHGAASATARQSVSSSTPTNGKHSKPSGWRSSTSG
jgi:ketosteroid isomerase-like protein